MNVIISQHLSSKRQVYNVSWLRLYYTYFSLLYPLDMFMRWPKLSDYESPVIRSNPLKMFDDCDDYCLMDCDGLDGDEYKNCEKGFGCDKRR